MRRLIEFDELKNSNDFWQFFIRTNFPTTLNEADETIWDVMDKNGYCFNSKWVNEFTKKYDGVFEINDGYLDNPTAIQIDMNNNTILTIEFHPGDNIYFINECEIGSTGPSYSLKKISWNEYCEYTRNLDYKNSFLLLPMVYIKDTETTALRAHIVKIFETLKINNQEILEVLVSNFR